MKTVAIYCRVSTDEQSLGYSLTTQAEGCLKYAAEHGYHAPAEFIYMEDYTGASLERPKLDLLRKVAQDRSVDGVLVWDLDRLARKVVYQMLIEEEFEKYKAPIEYVNDKFENTPEGNLQKQIRASLAEFERAKIKERTLRGRRGRAQAGYVHTGRTAPYGYRYVRGERKGWLEVVPEEARIVKMIFEWYVRGDETGARLGTQALTARLSSMRIPTKNEALGHPKTKKSSGVWSISTVKKILKSEVYAGVWHFNKTKRTSNNTRVSRPEDEWIAVQVPAIISHELWEAAQRTAQENKILSPHNTRRIYLVQSRLKCANCGYMFLTYSDGRNTRRPKGYYYCGGQKVQTSSDFANKPCHRSLRQEVWDERIWRKVAAMLKDPYAILEAMGERQREAQEELCALRGWLASVEAKIEALDQKRAKLLGLFLDPNIPLSKEVMAEKSKALTQERDRYAREAEDLRQRLSKASTLEQDMDQVRRDCAKVAQGIDMFSEQDRKATIAALNIVGLVRRGATPDDDVILLSGYIPAMEVTAYDAAVTGM